MSGRRPIPAQALAVPAEPGLGAYFRLLKPRVMSLVVFTALAGLVAAPVWPHPVLAAASILFIAIGAGAAGALNMWWDSDIDRAMRRTRNRPVPAGQIAPDAARDLGLGLGLLSVIMLGLAANWLAAALLAFTIFFYAVVYSIWLKRRTPQNIVIGGLAGAMPPLVGWTAATGGLAVEPLLMVALIFFWTPPHFWALALFVRDDYDTAGVPMLTVTHGRAETRRQILAYSGVLAGTALALGLSPAGGPLFLAVAFWANARFLRAAWVVRRRDDATAEADGYAAEKRLFRLSLGYLFWHFLALMAASLLTRAGLGLPLVW
jgi:protoheme IX farnesyltransferase